MKKVKSIFSYLASRPIIFCLIASPLMNLFIESLHRRSFASGLSHLIFNPMIFAYNSLIIFMTLSFAMLFKRKYFFFSIILAFWTVLGVVNGVLRSFRDNPLTAVDFFIAKASGDFIRDFFGWWQIILALLAVFLVAFLAVLLWKKGPRPTIKRMSALSIVLVSLAVVGSATVVGKETEMLSDDFDNITEAYENYGFAYCFSCSVLDTGIEKPEDYSKETVESILSVLPEDVSDAANVKPDIVMVQLESFFDVRFIKGVTASEEIMPNFRSLTERYPSGLLSVQSIGGGTANTEFEVLTGMNLDYFGPGEYPYMTVLCDDTIPALPHFLSLLGYVSHAFHNYTGVFYERHRVYANLGFDTFTPMEYMQGLEYNPRGWANDACLIPYITDALDREEGNTFVWAVSVQPHGAYEDERIECKYDIKLGGLTEEQINSYEYYANQVREVDDFIGALVSELEGREEPTVLVLYGDHLPPLEIDESQLDGISLYQSEYVIWSNYDMGNTDADLEAYQLTPHVLELVGYNCGTMTKVNQSLSDTAEYQKALLMLEYDIIYGERYSMNGKREEPKVLKLGIDDVVITDIAYDGEMLTVSGENFTEYSVVSVDGNDKETVYIDSHTLTVEGVRLRGGDEISVAQVANSGVVLGESNKIKAEES